MLKTRHPIKGLVAKVRGFQLFDATGLDPTLKRSLYFVVYGAMLSQIMGFITTGAPWTGFLRDVLRADDFALGLIAAVPVAANTIQLLAAYLLQRTQKRRLFIIVFGMIGRFFWIPIALTPYLVPAAFADARIMMVVCFVVIISLGNCFLNIGFSSLIADLVPMRIRGNYFSARHGASLLTGIVGSLAASVIVDRMGMPGYTVVLIIAGVFGMIDLCCFFFVEFPPMHVHPDQNKQGFFTMLGEVFRDKRFMLVVLCFTGWSFAVNISSPFFNVFMLEKLGMKYTSITLFTQIAQNICSVMFVRRWGRPLDRYGSKIVIQIAGLVCMVTPIIWLYTTPANTWFIVVASVLNGIFWPAMDLGQQNAYLSTAPEENRAMYIAVFFAVVNLVGVSLGNTLGGTLVQNVFTPLAASNPSFLGIQWTQYHFIILLSTILRILVVVLLFRVLRDEVDITYRQALSNMMSEWRGKLLRFHIASHRRSLRRKYRRAHQEKIDTLLEQEEMEQEVPDDTPRE